MSPHHRTTMTITPSAVAHRRERWLLSNSLRATIFRWLMGPQGHLLANHPLYQLPASLKLTAETKLLDIGCGRGTLMSVFDEQVQFRAPPIGIDLSPEMLRLGVQDNRHQEFIRATASILPFEDRSFTFVTCGYVTKHLQDDEVYSLFRELNRVLAPGGLAMVWDFGPTGNNRLDQWNATVLGSSVERLQLRSTETLISLASECGFLFTRDAALGAFLIPPIPRASILIGIPPENFVQSSP